MGKYIIVVLTELAGISKGLTRKRISGKNITIYTDSRQALPEVG